MHSSTVLPLQMITPLPPATSGIAQYSRDLLEVVDGIWEVRVMPEAGRPLPDWRSIHRISQEKDLDAQLPLIAHLGNSGHHRKAMEVACRQSGIVVLHDVVLHHGRLGEFLRRRGGAEYRRTMERLYGDSGRSVAEEVLRGRMPASLLDMPLVEDYVSRARLTIVHSEYARDLVLARVPGATVVRVPMGIPLPAMVDQRAAREALGLSQDRFIVASITHVNPHKRLPVVMRALRRAVRRIPDTLFVVAGSVAPGIELAGEAEFYRLQAHVDLRGYVTDDEARLIARAADVCINLRHPSTGETSASLLRMLGAGRPVIVTDDDSSAEYPSEAVMPVAVGRFEDELIAELLVDLHDDSEVREERGRRARWFVERRHTMQHAVAGYRRAVLDAYGVELPVVSGPPAHEQAPELGFPHRDRRVASPHVDVVADSLLALGLQTHEPTMRSAAKALVELDLDRRS